MNSISILLKKIRNFFPYFLLIAIYFFFINLEATKDKENKINSERDITLPNAKSSVDVKSLRISIPVIPYSE